MRVERLGKAMALKVRGGASGVEVLHWDAIDALAREDVEDRLRDT